MGSEESKSTVKTTTTTGSNKMTESINVGDLKLHHSVPFEAPDAFDNGRADGLLDIEFHEQNNSNPINVQGEICITHSSRKSDPS
jgi:hypothetical protein